MTTRRDDTTGASVNVREHEDSRRVLRNRRLFSDITVVVVIAVFLLGITNVVGVRSRDVSASGDGYELRVHYGEMSRAGLATPFEIEVGRDGGFGGALRLALRADYFSLFDENGLDPQPTSETTLGPWLVWEFEQPPGDSLVVSYDARIEPARQLGGGGWVAVLDDQDRPIVEVEFETTLLP